MRVRKSIRDYYRTLGIDVSASNEEIRAAYRRLAKKYHPDVSTSRDAELRMRMINEAYAVLGNRTKRALYDYIFLAYSKPYSQEGAVDIPAANLLPMPWWGGFRYTFAYFAVLIVGLKVSLDLVVMSMALFAAALYVVFGQAELAAWLFALLLISATIVLMVRIFAEIFDRAGVHQADPSFHEMTVAPNNSRERTGDSPPKARDSAESEF
jgi:hypothetical protein